MSVRRLLFLEVLRELGDLDCSTPHCKANQVGTGWVDRGRGEPSWWMVETYCPDCKSYGFVGRAATSALVEQLLRAPDDHHARVYSDWARATRGR